MAEKEQAGRPVYLDDPRLDKMLGTILELAAELYVVKDRQRVTEELLRRRGLLDPAEIDNFEPDVAWIARMHQERDALIARLLRDILAD